MILKYLISIIIGITFSLQIKAQTDIDISSKEVKGFYLTWDDFKTNRLTMPIDNMHKEDKINLGQFFVSPEIVSFEQKDRLVFKKDSIFAMKMEDGEVYRFINRIPSQLVDTSYLYIYVQKTITESYKRSGPRRIMQEVPVTNYYFSLPGKQMVYFLSFENLRKYAISSTEILNLMEEKFKNDEMLQAVNPCTDLYLLNEMFVKYVKSK